CRASSRGNAGSGAGDSARPRSSIAPARPVLHQIGAETASRDKAEFRPAECLAARQKPDTGCPPGPEDASGRIDPKCVNLPAAQQAPGELSAALAVDPGQPLG